jgi:beta-lactam-binding protein with PASTA domain
MKRRDPADAGKVISQIPVAGTAITKASSVDVAIAK